MQQIENLHAIAANLVCWIFSVTIFLEIRIGKIGRLFFNMKYILKRPYF